jgi:hypothetical protein
MTVRTRRDEALVTHAFFFFFFFFWSFMVHGGRWANGVSFWTRKIQYRREPFIVIVIVLFRR